MPSTGKYGPQKSLYLDTFHAVVKELYAALKYGWLCLKQAIGANVLITFEVELSQ